MHSGSNGNDQAIKTDSGSNGYLGWTDHQELYGPLSKLICHIPNYPVVLAASARGRASAMHKFRIFPHVRIAQ